MLQTTTAALTGGTASTGPGLRIDLSETLQHAMASPPLPPPHRMATSHRHGAPTSPSIPHLPPIDEEDEVDNDMALFGLDLDNNYDFHNTSLYTLGTANTRPLDTRVDVQAGHVSWGGEDWGFCLGVVMAAPHHGTVQGLQMRAYADGAAY
ncbi:hypothetical protein P691DRAFT_791113 [Macrolepiota fuliginosa MF-IS2]|uniref:Uncharacterized protein n=1 Tax=Macrolepiota fuliginosa MF-IS2 TaxID=1400762 RepID=A0A9P6BXK9_9AGAR|nr:hypothetical protein P691DRAFT_791113 [Macrolepiota fuliginosa MF-IS2]